MMMAQRRRRLGVDAPRLAGPLRDHQHRLRRRHALPSPTRRCSSPPVAAESCSAAAPKPLTPTAIQGFINMTAISSSGPLVPLRRRARLRHRRGAGVLCLENWDRAVAAAPPSSPRVLGGASTADAHHHRPPPRRVRRRLLHGRPSPTPACPPRRSARSTPTAPPPRSTTPPRPGHRPGLRGHNSPPSPPSRASPATPSAPPAPREAAASVLSIQRRLIPPTMGTHHRRSRDPRHRRGHRHPPALDPVGAAVNSFGFGGHNGCLVFGPPA